MDNSNPNDPFSDVFSFPPAEGTKEAEEYEKFVLSMVPFCHCRQQDRPCEGVLAGGVCDDIQDPEPEYDEDPDSL